MSDPVATPPAAPADRPRRHRRRLASAGFLVAAWWGTGLFAAHLATRPRPRPIPVRTELAGQAVEAATATTADGVTVRGWFVRAGEGVDGAGDRAVVLAAGKGGCRLSMTAGANSISGKNLE